MAGRVFDVFLMTWLLAKIQNPKSLQNPKFNPWLITRPNCRRGKTKCNECDCNPAGSENQLDSRKLRRNCEPQFRTKSPNFWTCINQPPENPVKKQKNRLLRLGPRQSDPGYRESGSMSLACDGGG